VAVAGHQIALMTSAVTFMVPLGLSLGVTVRVGRAVGQGDPAAIRRAGLAGLAVMAACQCVSCALMLFASHPIAGLFTHVPAVVALGSALLTLAAVFQFADGTQVVAMASLRGLQDTRVPMLLAMLAYWLLGVPLGAWLAFCRRRRGRSGHDPRARHQRSDRGHALDGVDDLMRGDQPAAFEHPRRVLVARTPEEIRPVAGIEGRRVVVPAAVAAMPVDHAVWGGEFIGRMGEARDHHHGRARRPGQPG
jgi:hypothetical protein